MSAVTHVSMPGTNTNYIKTPDSAGLSPTGDIDLRALVALDDWTPSASKSLIAKQNNAGGQRSFNLGVGNGGGNNGQLILQWTESGGTAKSELSSVSNAIADGTLMWIRATLEVNVAGVYNVKFYTAPDVSGSPGTWTQLGSTKVGAAATSVFDSTTAVSLGSNIGDTANGGALWSGKYVKAQILNGVAGTVVGSFDATSVNRTGTRTPSTMTDAQGNVWTPQGTGWDWVGPVTFTGAAASTLPALTHSAAGTHTAPVFTGTAGSVLAALAQTAAGTSTAPVFTGAASSALPALTQTAEGTVPPVFTGTASQTLPSFTQAATGTHTPPVFTGTAAQSLPALAQTVAGTVTAPTVAGTAATVLASFTQSAAGTVDNPGVNGVAATVLPAFTQTASGTHAAPVCTADAAQTLPAFTQSAAGTFTSATVTGAATSILAAFGQAATGTVTAPVLSGTAASVLAAVTQAAVGNLAVLTATPAERVWLIAAELRRLTVAAEVRRVTVARERRVMEATR